MLPPLRWVGTLPQRRADVGQVRLLARLNLCLMKWEGCLLPRQSVERRSSSMHEKPSAVRSEKMT